MLGVHVCICRVHGKGNLKRELHPTTEAMGTPRKQSIPCPKVFHFGGKEAVRVACALAVSRGKEAVRVACALAVSGGKEAVRVTCALAVSGGKEAVRVACALAVSRWKGGSKGGLCSGCLPVE